MAQNSKVESYIGFCFKAKKIILGSSAIGVFRGRIYLLILDGKAQKNSLRYAIKYKNRFDCPLLVCNGDFEGLIKKSQCRLAAICDESLAKAILNSGDSLYELYNGGDE